MLMGCVSDSASSLVMKVFSGNMWIGPGFCWTRAVVFNICGVVDPFENLVKIVLPCPPHSVSGSLWTRGIHDRETKSGVYGNGQQVE